MIVLSKAVVQVVWPMKALSKPLRNNSHMSCVVRKPTFWIPTWSHTNQALELQKMARGLKFRI